MMSIRKEFVTNSPEESISLAHSLGKILRAGDVIAYSGDLGAGKTTFTRGLASGMGLSDLVTSPTFSLVHVYGRPPLQLCHFDMYRITDPDELETTGYYDYLPEESVFAIEWSENIISALPDDLIQIRIETLGETSRKIILEVPEITENSESKERRERFADFGN
ncbi:MAG: tRNA (adenosine(37)-N6)-threonylcarbamoyltransferase complex ATPase subunit type 1 TsaE [Oscillospiraceae bacterium]|nr:tRNA (adenosine(37)-N6)-threonylcarbamoyltransferase complex ATPase subunit type 1 TsaE [Oscillospiraceae bacterium]